MSKLAMIHQGQRLSETPSGLADRVARLSNPVGVLAGGYRTLRGNNAQSLLAGLLGEIDETILPRRIKVLTNTDRVAYLTVANRRLIRVAVPGGQIDGNSTAPASAAGTVAQLLALFNGASRAVVHSARSDDGLCQSEPGFAISTLADAASGDLAGSKSPDPVQAFDDALAGLALARVTLDSAGHPRTKHGDPAWCQRLENLARSGLADIDAQMVQSLTAPDQPGCIFLNTGGDDGFILVYARSQSSGFLATLPSRHFSSIQTAWLALFG